MWLPYKNLFSNFLMDRDPCMIDDYNINVHHIQLHINKQQLRCSLLTGSLYMENTYNSYI